MENVKKLFPDGLPTLAELAVYNKGKDVPPETAWIWGADDELGRINLLTPEHVRQSKEAELKEGKMVSLNWTTTLPAKPSFHRQGVKYSIRPNPINPCIFDDFYDCNSQSGSQWDGFRHFGHLGINRLYNNLTSDEVLHGTRCGIQAVAQHGIAGRAVLLDFYSWIQAQGRPYDPVGAYAISAAELRAVATAQDVVLKQGDILLVRSGYVPRYHALQTQNPARLEELAKVECFSGVEQSDDMKRFLHDSYFAAVGGDAPAFECWPPKTDYYLHEYLLALWGCMIGEMLDLEELAVECQKRKRWSFFLTSAPFNTPGGIATYANALAFF